MICARYAALAAAELAAPSHENIFSNIPVAASIYMQYKLVNGVNAK
jgi:hypothetical protein